MDNARAATFAQRAGAYLIDAGIVTGGWLAAVFAVGIVDTGVDDESDWGIAIGLFVILFGPVSWFTYQWIANSRGVSPGKKIFRLAIEPTPDVGRLPVQLRPGPGFGLLRTIGQVIGIAPLGIGFWWALWDPQNQAWHDRLASTRVVYEAAPSANQSPRWRWSAIWQGRNREQEQLALKEALDEEIPPTLANLTFDTRLGRWWVVALHLFHVVFFVDILVLARVLGWDLGFLALFAGLFLVSLSASWPELYGLTQKLTISGEGLRLRRLWNENHVPWYAVSRVLARPNLVSMRVAALQCQLTWSASALSIEKRKELMLSIRARLPATVPIQEWSGQQVAAFVPGGLLGAVGVALLFASSLLGAKAHPALGIRCSVASEYLREHFGLPDERGCVVLRVSGPAERAGIRVGDLMVEMDGVPVVSGGQFSILLEDSDHDTFAFKMFRRGAPGLLDFRVKLGPSKGPPSDPKDPFFYYLRARGDTERKRLDQDIADYSRAIEMVPEFDIAYLYRGELFQEIGEVDAARADYARAIELSPELGIGHRWYATLLQETGEPAEALSGFLRAIQLDECQDGFTTHNVECAEDYLLLAGLYMGTNIERVRDAAERSIEFYPSFAEPYYQLTVIHNFLDQDAQARLYAERYFAFPSSDTEPEKVAALKALLEGSSFNCDGQLQDAPRFHCSATSEPSDP